MKKQLFINLIGKTRYEVAQELGYGFNCFDNEIWIYEVGKTWIGRRVILSIKFENDKASELFLYKTFNKR
ncbi:hypothetical protein CEY12_01885 [Chryseobacterium sp. T16E-39]|uniref:hypothetical protein n=1 Tax=Chryseobacterium sp. T16E-39 TaxID=2015076 RepID=UPI000B5B30F2|nr:hypothetical protein [Chryseobacterium sp. T16E-39]ASK32642.1 hypothetical protein CEY12_01885 [Chryseobacterium sp. T16E-39]